jgi:cytidine deaminase
MAQFDVCAERHAINELLYAEPGSALDAILVATPVPDETAPPPTPCGACRHAIHQFGDDAAVYCTTFVREDDGWTTFPRVERFTATELYPGHQGHPSWD